MFYGRIALLCSFICLFSAGTLQAHEKHRDEGFLPGHGLSGVVIEHAGFTLQYSEEHEQALWVAYELTVAELRGSFKRSDNFREDPAVPTGSASLADYRRSGYDRGHLAPAADMQWSGTAMSESFFLSNMSPQVPAFNRGIWKNLEEQVRDWSRAYEALYIVTGPVLTQPPLGVIGKNKVAVPAAYFKVIVDFVPPDRKGIGFLLPNGKSEAPLPSYAVSIDRIEQVTGLDFFPALEDSLEEAIESYVNVAAWTWPSGVVALETPPPSAAPQEPTVAPDQPSERPAWLMYLPWIILAVIVVIIMVKLL